MEITQALVEQYREQWYALYESHALAPECECCSEIVCNCASCYYLSKSLEVAEMLLSGYALCGAMNKRGELCRQVSVIGEACGYHK